MRHSYAAFSMAWQRRHQRREPNAIALSDARAIAEQLEKKGVKLAARRMCLRSGGPDRQNVLQNSGHLRQI